MKRLLFLVLSLSGFAVAPLHAQQSSGDCPAGRLDVGASGSDSTATTTVKRGDVTSPTPAASVTPTTEAERYVQNVISEDGLHVVHFWAPWCSNSRAELKNGWATVVRDNQDVTFTFVTVWNDGDAGSSILDEHNLPKRVEEVTQPDLGPSDDESKRRRSFLSHPVTWIPSTWIFHNNGELAFAMNYGEMEMETIQSLLDVTRKDW